MSEIEKLLRLLSEQQAKEQMVSKPYKGKISAQEHQEALDKGLEKATNETPWNILTESWGEMDKKREPIYEHRVEQELQKLRKQKGTGEYAFPNAIGMDENDPDYPEIRKTLKK